MFDMQFKGNSIKYSEKMYVKRLKSKRKKSGIK